MILFSMYIPVYAFFIFSYDTGCISWCFFYYTDLTWLRVWCVDCSDFLLSPAPGWCCSDHRGSVPGASGTGASPPPGPQCPIHRTSINLCRFRNNHGNLHNRYQSGKPQSDLKSIKLRSSLCALPHVHFELL